MQGDLLKEAESRQSALEVENTELKTQLQAKSLETVSWREKFHQLEQLNSQRLGEMEEESRSAMQSMEQKIKCQINKQGRPSVFIRKRKTLLIFNRFETGTSTRFAILE